VDMRLLKFWRINSLGTIAPYLEHHRLIVEAVGKSQNSEFSSQTVLYLQGSNFSKQTFSTASFGFQE
jgi:hypothetical protein